MEKNKKIAIYATLAFVIISTISLFAVLKNNSASLKAATQSRIHAQKQEESDFKPQNHQESQAYNTNDERYVLVLEGSMICAYKISGSEKTLVEKAPVEVSSLSQSEAKKLSEGIDAGSENEMYLYFEAYTS